MKISLIGRKNYKINDKIIIHIPTIDEIRGENSEFEDNYYKLISGFTATSTDYMSELYDCGINFEEFENDYEFFIFKHIAVDSEVFPSDCSLLFEGITKSNFKIIEKNNKYYIIDDINDIIIDENIFNQISSIICKSLFIKKEHRRFINKRALKYAVNRIKKLKQRHKDKTSSNLDEVILFAVNNSNFKYDFQTIGKLSIFDFYASIKQMQRNEHIDNVMIGGYTGNLKLNEFSDKQLSKFNVLN